MSVQVHILEGPLPAEPTAWDIPPDHGAMITFEGVVRPTEDGKPINALDYEAYEPMASNMLQKLGRGVLEDHRLLGVCVEHSVGRVGVGECSFRLRIASPHRKEALAAMDQFIDLMKRDVPLWKKPAGG